MKNNMEKTDIFFNIECQICLKISYFSLRVFNEIAWLGLTISLWQMEGKTLFFVYFFIRIAT